jgi:hypothetical protein
MYRVVLIEGLPPGKEYLLKLSLKGLGTYPTKSIVDYATNICLRGNGRVMFRAQHIAIKSGLILTGP